MFEIEALISLARALLETEGAGASRAIGESLERALALVGQTEARMLEPHVLVERARLAEHLGDRAGAVPDLREAHRLFTEMGATGHAERVRRELAALS